MPLFRPLHVDPGLKHRSIEDAVGSAFLQLLAGPIGEVQDQRYVLVSPFFRALEGPSTCLLSDFCGLPLPPCVDLYGC